MARMDNPYAGIINLMRQEGKKANAPDIMLGLVVTGLPGLKVRAGDIILDGDNLLLSDHLTTLNTGDTVVLQQFPGTSRFIVYCRAIAL